MRKYLLLASVLLAALSSNAFAADGEFYTQHNLWIFKGSTYTVNYAVDLFVPVNTKVKVTKENAKKIEMTLVESGTRFTFERQKKYTPKAMTEIKLRMLGDQPVDLTEISKDAQIGIKTGQVVNGMTRAEVLIARGYPPEHTTLGLSSDQWRFYQTKWNTIIVHFDNDKVVSIQN